MATTVFEHCRDITEAWTTFYTLACLCHPGQGGAREDMAALCAQARDALGPSWPDHWDADCPNLFDVFCAATGTRNPFGQSIAASGRFEQSEWVGPPGYRYGTSFYSLLAPRIGNVELVFSAAAAAAAR